MLSKSAPIFFYFFAGHLGNFCWKLIKFLRIRIAWQYIFYLNCNFQNAIAIMWWQFPLCVRNASTIELAGISSKRVFAPKENGSVRRSGPPSCAKSRDFVVCCSDRKPILYAWQYSIFQRHIAPMENLVSKKNAHYYRFYAMAKIPFPFLARGSHFII